MDSQDSETLAVKQRFDSFRLGQRSPTSPHNGRSHSRASSFSVSNTAQNIAQPDLTAAKRNSHHRRRSSVSTRTESADLMGIALPSLPRSPLEDNMNLGDKDSIRRRALWALEGKPDVAFQKVEIPELSADIEQPTFELSNKSSFSPVQFAFGGKRDSFRALSPSLLKDQLQTLVEEEEEEEQPRPVPFKKTTRPRPATLNLRPLSLTPNQNLPGLLTPTLTPSPRIRSAPLAADDTQSRWSNVANRSKLRNNCPDPLSSGLPSPAISPAEGQFSEGFDGGENQASRRRPLSIGEQHLLFESHHALLARITDLENAMSSHPHSSANTDVPDIVLNRDTEDLRQRISDLDKQIVLLTERLDSERRDTWALRSRVGLVEVEKVSLERALETERQETIDAKSERDRLNSETVRLLELLKSAEHDADQFRKESAALRISLESEQRNSQALRSEIKSLKKTTSSPGELSASFVFGRRREHSSIDSDNSTADEWDSHAPPKPPVVDGNVSMDQEEETFRSISHSSRASLSKTWTFPKGPSQASQPAQAQEVDRFFVCLDEIDESLPADCVPQSYESSKQSFAMGFNFRSQYFADDSEDMPPFFFPNAIAEIEHVPRSLDVVMEEDEEEEEEEEEISQSNLLSDQQDEDEFQVDSKLTSPTISSFETSAVSSPLFPPTTFDDPLQANHTSPSPSAKSKPHIATFIRQPLRTVQDKVNGRSTSTNSVPGSTRSRSLMLSVDLSSDQRVHSPSKHAPSSSFSSLVTSPLSALTNFSLSSFLSPRRAADVSPTSSSPNTNTRDRFVSKAQQLERLQARMRHEHLKTGAPPVDACFSCAGDMVFL